MAHGGKREGAGRKPGLASIIAERVRAKIAIEVEKAMPQILAKAIEQAKAGDKAAREWLSDQPFGKPVQPQSFSNPDGSALFKPTEAEREASTKALSKLFGK